MGSTYRILQLEETLREIIKLCEADDGDFITPSQEIRIRRLACSALDHPEGCVCPKEESKLPNHSKVYNYCPACDKDTKVNYIGPVVFKASKEVFGEWQCRKEGVNNNEDEKTC